MGLLSFDEILLVFGAAVSAELTKSREALLSGIAPALTDTLPRQRSEADQVLSDLHALNAIAALRDGSMPLRSWLANAIALSSTRQECRVFEQAEHLCDGEQDAGNKDGQVRLRRDLGAVNPDGNKARAAATEKLPDATPWWTWLAPGAALLAAIALGMFVLIPLFAEGAGHKAAHKLVSAAALGAALQEAAYWYSFRRSNAGNGNRHHALARSPGYWTITIVFICISTFGVLLWYQGAAPSPRDCMLAGAAFPALFKQTTSSVSNAGLPKLGTEHTTTTSGVHSLLRRLWKTLAAYLKLD